VNGEYGSLPANPTKKVKVKSDPKVGTKWTAAEDKLLTDLYGHYDDSAVKRNLNHRTWNGIKSRANRLKLKSRKQVLADRKRAQKQLVQDKVRQAKVDRTKDETKTKIDEIVKKGKESGYPALARITQKLCDQFVKNGFVTEDDVEECKNRIQTLLDAWKGSTTWAEKLDEKIEAREFVNGVAKEIREARRGKLSPEMKTIAQQVGDVYNIERMRTTTDPKEYDRLEAIYGKAPWLPNSEYAKRKDINKIFRGDLTYPGTWQDKVVTKPELPQNALRLLKSTHDSLVSHGVTMPDIDPPRARYFAHGKEVDKNGNPLDKLPCLLAGTRVYLCGAMDRVPDGGVEWRKRLTPRLKELGVVLFDPTNKPFYDGKGDESDRKQREEWVKNGEYDKIREFVKEFRGGDLRMVNNCDFVIIYIDVNVHMCGSYEEIAIATHEKKPILVVCEQGKPRTPQWLFGQLPHEHIFGSFDELMTYLHGIDEHGLDDESGRWYFYRPDVLFADHVLDRLKRRRV
jgi:hypothetical protein